MSDERETEGLFSDDGGEYDLVDEKAPTATKPRKSMRGLRSEPGAPAEAPHLHAGLRRSRGTPTSPTKPTAPTLAYAGLATPGAKRASQMPPANARGGAADPFLARNTVLRDLTVPASVAGIGGALLVGCAWGATGSASIAAAWVATNFVFDSVVLLITLLIAVWLLDNALESVPSVALKVSAIVLGPSGISLALLWLDSGGGGGFILGGLISLGLFCFLLSYLFELDFTEVATVFVLNLIVNLAANGIWLATIGTWGYLL